MILDFNIAEGDQIDVAAIDARRHTSGDQSFHFIGGHRFTEHAGQLRYKHGVASRAILTATVAPTFVFWFTSKPTMALRVSGPELT